MSSGDEGITKGTYVSIGLVLVLVAGVLGSVGWVDSRIDTEADKQTERYEELAKQLTEQNEKTLGKLDALDRSVERLKESAERSWGDRWTRTDMRLWVERLRGLNPDLTVPNAER